MASESFLLKHVLRDHVLAGGAVAAVLLARWSPAWCLAFWLSNILIDLDHYLNLLFWSGLQALRFHQTFHFYSYIKEHKREGPFISLELFHTAEFAAAAALGAYAAGVGILKPVLAGLLFHIFMDYFHLRRLGALRTRQDSLLQFLWRKRQLEGRGVFPTALYKDAAKAAARDCRDCGWAGF